MLWNLPTRFRDVNRCTFRDRLNAYDRRTWAPITEKDMATRIARTALTGLTVFASLALFASIVIA